MDQVCGCVLKGLFQPSTLRSSSLSACPSTKQLSFLGPHPPISRHALSHQLPPWTAPRAWSRCTPETTRIRPDEHVIWCSITSSETRRKLESSRICGGSREGIGIASMAVCHPNYHFRRANKPISRADALSSPETIYLQTKCLLTTSPMWGDYCYVCCLLLKDIGDGKTLLVGGFGLCGTPNDLFAALKGKRDHPRLCFCGCVVLRFSYSVWCESIR